MSKMRSLVCGLMTGALLLSMGGANGKEGSAVALAFFRAGEEMGIAAVHAPLDGEAQADGLLMDMLESVQFISNK